MEQVGEADAVQHLVAHAGDHRLVVATDAPLLPHQLDRVAARVALGVGRMGGKGENSSGDIFIAFSTANPEVGKTEGTAQLTMLPNERITPLLRAAADATEEAIVNALHKISNEEIKVKVLTSGVGAITESDVTLASASGAPIIGFNVRPNAKAREIAERNAVERVLAPLSEGWDGVVPGLPLADTVKRVDGGAVVEIAERGTIFLDEIGEMPTLLQAKLLRVLEERLEIHDAK